MKIQVKIVTEKLKSTYHRYAIAGLKNKINQSSKVEWRNKMKKSSIVFLTTMIMLSVTLAPSAFAFHVRDTPSGAHMWLETSSAAINVTVPKPFNVTVLARNVTATDSLIGIEFEMPYVWDSLKILNVYEGSFLKNKAPFGTFWAANDEATKGRLVVGQMIYPDNAGSFNLTDLPSGDGDVATITFLPKTNDAASFTITPQPLLGETVFLNSTGDYLPYLDSKGTNYTYTPYPQPTISINPNSLTFHNTFSADIQIVDLLAGWKLTHAEITVLYNATELGVVGVSEGTFMSQFGSTTFNALQDVGQVEMTITLTPATLFPSGTGVLGTILFNTTLRPPAMSTLTLDSAVLLDPDGYTVYADLNNGNYTMNEALVHAISEGGNAYPILTVSDASINTVPMLFDGDHRILSFNVTGDGTPTFVNITVPNSLIQANLNNWLVLIDAQQTTPTVTAINATYTLISINYNFTNQTVRILGTSAIPEIPTNMLPLLLLLATAATIGSGLVYRRRNKLRSSK
jgi:hypothetical protein